MQEKEQILKKPIFFSNGSYDPTYDFIFKYEGRHSSNS